ncbi:type VI secretion system protein TssL [Mesorhizobium sp. M4B.F.Ca.ET.215.01.1.1]|uniref:type VI secretion system protein TssL, long form n=3 Tax=Mesorhizobium TaxID=68287 RepID=UPI000FD5F5D7|nr:MULTISPECIES: type VI secretion system protein TssL, long form [unclassified Mesorhizobium]RUW21331.1 type VI secretion system protein TssL [Mesorhizobium sp. M4B.F.Ca.ET.013.02.1.1]RWF28423.1 MAG: type VI secretion system protein TssL [Mesorhizobium sp.]RWF65044.1 MAG: type VI secretion system protein TssL [Mesorhizobium sp.]TGQ09396.1 type VI secretion system protein TssL [Mesorhizobium sp. M4B.F.Ca.ET.215.01.1.1]TGQ31106.1 type VI secretion system protein TssL [Mesorhizobium sp. M4B.F.Ca
MSSKDDPFGPAGKTVIRANPRRRQKSAPSPPASADGGQPLPVRDSTVFDPQGGQHMPPGWASGTVIYQGAASNAGPLETAHSAAPHQDVLLDAAGSITYPTANPILAAAAPLLLLFGQLRLIPVERHAEPLAGHIAEAIEKFDRTLQKSGIAEEDARIAKFALCETADDLVGNLPWPEGDGWAGHAMLSRFFHIKSAGAGFYEALNKLLAAPEAHYDLLELMHACLSLGFEGQYRGLARQGDNLERIRRDVFDTLRYFQPPASQDISPRWQGMAAVMAQPSARLPLWAVAAAAATLVTAAFFVLRVLITDEGDATAGELLALNPSTPVTIERAGVAPLAEPAKVAPPPPTPVALTQINRIRAALAKDLVRGGLAVGTQGSFIVVEINNVLMFEPGKAELKPEFQSLAADIAGALDAEPGPIRIVGHTDNAKPRKSSTFKSNFDLSVARAKAVEALMAPGFKDPSRITADGKGEDEPIADNATPQGRATNRRVDVMIPKEETL